MSLAAQSCVSGSDPKARSALPARLHIRRLCSQESNKKREPASDASFFLLPKTKTHSRFNLRLRTPQNTKQIGRNCTRLEFSGTITEPIFRGRGNPSRKRGTLEHPETQSSSIFTHGCVGSIVSPVNPSAHVRARARTAQNSPKRDLSALSFYSRGGLCKVCC